MRVVIVGQDCDPRSNTVWFEVLRQMPDTRLFLPVEERHESASMSRLQEVAPDLYARIHLVRVRTPLGETSTLWSGLRRELQEANPELIHVVAEPWAPVAQRVSRWRWPFVIHGAENILETAPWPYRIRRTGMRGVLRRAGGAVSWGHTGLAAMWGAGLPAGTPTALCASRLPDPSAFPATPLPRETTPLRVAYVGRMIKAKGVQTLLQALGLLPLGVTELRLLGDGPYRNSLERRARKLDLPVDFLGHGSETDVADLIRWSHIVVVPTLVDPRFKEQWGRIAAEAMMSSRAVVVSDSGELPLLVADPEMVFPHGDEVELAGLLGRLSADRTLLEQKARAVAERSKAFAPEIQARTLIEFWKIVGESST